MDVKTEGYKKNRGIGDVDLEKNAEDKITNDEVLRRVGENRILIREIRKRKGNWMGHIMRSNCLLLEMMEGVVEGDKKRGRKRMKMIDLIKEKNSYVNLKKRAEEREEWRSFYKCSSDLLGAEHYGRRM